MSWNKRLHEAEKHRISMQKILSPLANKVRDFLDDDTADVFYQTDGWCVVYGDNADNAPCNMIDFDELFDMSVKDALAYLEKISI